VDFKAAMQILDHTLELVLMELMVCTQMLLGLVALVVHSVHMIMQVLVWEVIWGPQVV
jgi:hypothetical protein